MPNSGDDPLTPAAIAEGLELLAKYPPIVKKIDPAWHPYYQLEAWLMNHASALLEAAGERERLRGQLAELKVGKR